MKPKPGDSLPPVLRRNTIENIVDDFDFEFGDVNADQDLVGAKYLQ